MSDLKKCPKCGAELPIDSAPGQCARCLLQLGFESAEEPTVATKVVTSITEKTGDHIGRYKLRERLGEGGCGVVYVADQEEPVRRRVALKVIKLGMDTNSVVARFEAERQALAMMDHPNIAKVFDAGSTETGRPYFVMELVRGVRITDYCDQNNLSTKERLDLFIKVCQAIQHAHQKGIIHRDIKPSNILVTLHDGVPVPKVIDFGIAKATEGRLTEATVYTQLHQFMGTPAYMSPEQAEMSGLDIDTRSDIYSLGVLLYELLAGTTPFDAEELIASGIDAMRRTIREKEPVRPSTRLATLRGEELTATAKRRSADTSKLMYQLKGDLDWIVMRCLEKDRTRRYETANGLAADLRRHLDNEPVMARPPSMGYRLQKSFRRNKLVFAATGVVGLVLVLGVVVSSWQALRATKARRAEAAARLVADCEKQRAEKEAQNAKASELVARQNLYLADMNAVQQALQENNLGRANPLVEKYFPKPGEEDLRGIEWRYLWNLCQGEETLTLDFNDYAVPAVAFSPDGRLLALASFDNKVTIFDLASRKILKRLRGRFSAINSQTLAFSRDGKYLAAADKQAVNLWRTKDWQVAHRLEGNSVEGWTTAVAFSPDAKTVATLCNGMLAVWDASNGGQQSAADTKLQQDLTGNGHSLAYSADGKTIAITGDDQIELWNVQPLSKLDRFSAQLNSIASLAWSSKWLAAGSWNGDLKIWDVETGREIVSFKAHPIFAFALAFSPDGKTLATGGGDQKIHLWDLTSLSTNTSSGVTTIKKRATLQGHLHEVWGLDFSPDGHLLASGSKDGSSKLWSMVGGITETVLPGARAKRFSSDGKSLLTLNADYTLSYWDVHSRQKTRLVSPALDTTQVTAWAISTDRNTLATAKKDGTVEFLDLDKNTSTATRAVADGGRIDALKFSPFDRLVAIESVKGPALDLQATVRVLNRADDAHQGPFEGALSLFAFSPDEARLATGGADYSINVWDLATSRLLTNLRKHTFVVHRVAFAPNGKLLMTASFDNTIRLWDTATWTEVGVLKGHMGGVLDAVFSTDGKTLVSIGAEAAIKMWNVETRKEIITLKTSPRDPDSILCSPDLSVLAVSASSEEEDFGDVLLLHAPSFSEIDAKEKAKRAAQIRVPTDD